MSTHGGPGCEPRIRPVRPPPRGRPKARGGVPGSDPTRDKAPFGRSTVPGYLAAFAICSAAFLNRAAIAGHVWDGHLDPFSNVVDVYMNRLRKKIDHGFEKPLLHTRRGEGYILSSSVTDRGE